MAKGQKKSNREAKKPKADKSVVLAVSPSAASAKTVLSSISLKKK